jgi:hypothetical protein
MTVQPAPAAPPRRDAPRLEPADLCLEAVKAQRKCSHCESENNELMVSLQCGLHRMCANCVHSVVQNQYYTMFSTQKFQNLYRLSCSRCHSTMYTTMPAKPSLFDSQEHIRFVQKVLAVVPLGAQKWVGSHFRCKICAAVLPNADALRAHLCSCISTTRCAHDDCSARVCMSSNPWPHKCTRLKCKKCHTKVEMNAHQLSNHYAQCEIFEFRLQKMQSDIQVMLGAMHTQHASTLRLMQAASCMNRLSEALHNAMDCPPMQVDD